MSAKEKAKGPPEVEFKPALRPHRGLFIGLCVALAVWVVVLVGIYIKTVYPMRHGGGGTSAPAMGP